MTREELRQRLWASDTFVDFDPSLNAAVKRLREALGDSADNVRFIETLPRHGYRFIYPVESASSTNEPPPISENAARTPEATVRVAMVWRKAWMWKTAAVLVVVVLVFGGLLLFRSRRTHALTESDTIVLADFDNRTGDAVFDDALKQALAIQLDQSPFLNVLSDRKVSETLRQMGRPTDERITMDVGRELCLRTGSTALLGGKISRLGSHYLVDLNAVACSTSDTLAKEQSEANGKEDVLRVLNQVSSRLRTKLGESLASVKKYDVPDEATTRSLEALQSFSMARKILHEKGPAATVPFLQRTIELDPNFPMAYAAISLRTIRL